MFVLDLLLLPLGAVIFPNPRVERVFIHAKVTRGLGNGLIRLDGQLHRAFLKCSGILFRSGLTHRTHLLGCVLSLVSVCPEEYSHIKGRARYMEYAMSSLTLFVGIAVSKDTLAIAVRPTAETWQVAKEAAEISTLVAQLEAMAPALVVLEATGGFEGHLRAALAIAAVPVVRAHPRQVRACAHAVGLVAKTDRIDARVLAHCAEAVTPV